MKKHKVKLITPMFTEEMGKNIYSFPVSLNSTAHNHSSPVTPMHFVRSPKNSIMKALHRAR